MVRIAYHQPEHFANSRGKMADKLFLKSVSPVIFCMVAE